MIHQSDQSRRIFVSSPFSILLRRAMITCTALFLHGWYSPTLLVQLPYLGKSLQDHLPFCFRMVCSPLLPLKRLSPQAHHTTGVFLQFDTETERTGQRMKQGTLSWDLEQRPRPSPKKSVLHAANLPLSPSPKSQYPPSLLPSQLHIITVVESHLISFVRSRQKYTHWIDHQENIILSPARCVLRARA